MSKILKLDREQLKDSFAKAGLFDIDALGFTIRMDSTKRSIVHVIQNPKDVGALKVRCIHDKQECVAEKVRGDYTIGIYLDSVASPTGQIFHQEGEIHNEYSPFAIMIEDLHLVSKEPISHRIVIFDPNKVL
ncbi:hypothetical protein CN931_24020 [Bacillus sp. AFS054943]|uniref:Uncharacterized protein n=1 Tax=Bacillus cereus TaxID=1396 RepID=A0A2C1LPS0_BACCE|nr:MULTISPECIES: hypothetical protein [Bacillus]PGL78082.1 hypothetical protein CN931_24020 [Bacillus sp. AFS054943]PGT99868.1 hypothetical protein COD19_18220 [Bacillus cereus]